MELHETSADLLETLRLLGDEYGPLGVAEAAAQLTDADALIQVLIKDKTEEPTDMEYQNLSARIKALLREYGADQVRTELARQVRPMDSYDFSKVERADRVKTALWPSDMREVLEVAEKLQGINGVSGDMAYIREDGEELAVIWFDGESDTWLVNMLRGSGA